MLVIISKYIMKGMHKMKRSILKKSLAILVVLVMTLSSLILPASAVAPIDAAQALYEFGLFRGIGNDEDGNPIFNLEGNATRAQGIAMLVRLLGAADIAYEGGFEIPFEDVDTEAWYFGYIGYAYTMGYASGVSDTLFRPDGELSAAMFLTFALRALGYVSGEDFEWDAAWDLTDELYITITGQYTADRNTIDRGGMVRVAFLTLLTDSNTTGNMLIQDLVDAGGIDADAIEVFLDIRDNPPAVEPPIGDIDDEDEEDGGDDEADE